MSMSNYDGCNELTVKDKILLDILTESKESHIVIVDNDDVWVEKKYPKGDKTEDIVVGSFDRFGQDLIISLFEYMSIEAEHV